MKSVSKDAHSFVEGIISHLKQTGKAREVTPRVQSLLVKMTASSKRDHQARVESAVKLNSAETQAIARVLSRIIGREVSLTSTVNPSLIGGLKITLADWVMDSSVGNELTRMANIITAT